MLIQLITNDQQKKEVFDRFTGNGCEIIVHKPVQIRKNSMFKSKPIIIIDESLSLLKLILNKNLYSKKLNFSCSDHHYSTLFFCKVLSILKRKPQLYLFNFYLHNLGKYIFIQKILKYLLNQNVSMIVQSKTEKEYFKKINNKIDIKYFPYCCDEIIGHDQLKTITGDYIFSGGYTNRDYNLLIKCANSLPSQKFTIVCSNLNKITEKIPNNVTIYKEIPAFDFHKLMAESRSVAIPLLDDVGSSGQMVALAAMQLKKAVIYPNYDVISQYFDDKKNGLMYKGQDLSSLKEMIKYTSSDSNTEIIENIGKRAKECWEKSYKENNFTRAICKNMTDFFNCS